MNEEPHEKLARHQESWAEHRSRMSGTAIVGASAVSVLADPLAEIEGILGKRGAMLLVLTSELAVCIGALRGVADGMDKTATTPETAKMLRGIADTAFAALTRAAVTP